MKSSRLIGGVAMCAIALVPTVAQATPASAKPLSSRGFWVINRTGLKGATGAEAKLTSITGGNRFEGAPTPGATLPPSTPPQLHDYELQVRIIGNEVDTASYEMLDPSNTTIMLGTVDVNMSIDEFGGN